MNTETVIFNTAANWFDEAQDAQWLAMFEMMIDGAEYAEGLRLSH